MLAARLQAFEDMFNHGGTELTEKISRDSSTLGNLITRHIAEFDRTVKTYGGELVERLGQRTQDVTEAMRNYVDTFDQRVSGRTNELSTTLNARLSQFEELLGQRVTGLAQTLTDGGQEVVGALDKRIGEVAGTINARGTEVADAIGAKTAELDQTLGARALEVANTLDSRIGRFEELLVGRAETVTKQIETRTKAAADALNSRMEQLSQAIKIQFGRSRTLARRAGALHHRRDPRQRQRGRAHAGRHERRGGPQVRRQGRGNRQRGQLPHQRDGDAAVRQQRRRARRDHREGPAVRLRHHQGHRSGDVVDRGEGLRLHPHDAGQQRRNHPHQINSAGETASTSVTRTLNELNDTAQKAIAQSKETATATVSEMLETHNMLRADTTALFERLREANIMLQEVLSGSHENMSALENTLMLRVSEFVTAMNEVTASTGGATDRVERNITNFREITSHVVTDLGQLAGQFDAHGRDLAKAAELVDRSNQRTEDTVNERRVQLDSLVSTLDIRTEDIEQRLKRFSGLLDESLEAASNRAREVARVVSEIERR